MYIEKVRTIISMCVYICFCLDKCKLFSKKNMFSYMPSEYDIEQRDEESIDIHDERERERERVAVLFGAMIDEKNGRGARAIVSTGSRGAASPLSNRYKTSVIRINRFHIRFFALILARLTNAICTR